MLEYNSQREVNFNPSINKILPGGEKPADNNGAAAYQRKDWSKKDICHRSIEHM